MSRYLTDNAVAQFDATVKVAYQGMGMLRPAVRVVTGVIGSTHRFPKIGTGIATQRIPQTDVVPMGVAHTKATATLTDWIASDYTDLFDQQKVNYSERALLGTVIAGGITRREDQLILDAMDAASTSLTVASSVGSVTTQDVAKLRRAKRLLNDVAAPGTDRHYLMSTIGLENLLGTTETTSADYNTVKTLVNGEINTFVGFAMHTMETRTEGGLPLSGSDRTNYAWHGGPMGAIGLAIGLDFRTEVNYIPEKTSWLAAGLFSAGATAIDANGLVEVTTTE